MIVTLKCGCTINDAVKSTVHHNDGHHYPLGTGPGTFCAKCNLYKPCACAPSRPPVACEQCHKPIRKYIPEGMLWYPCTHCNGRLCEDCCENKKETERATP